MILDKEAEVTFSSGSFEHYSKLGYKPVYRQKFTVKIEDLTLGSAVLINAKCDECGAEIKFKYQAYTKNTKNLTEPYYCKTCAIKIRNKNTNLLRYGVEHASQSETIKLKNKKTCLEQHGVEYVSQRKDVKEKKANIDKNKSVEEKNEQRRKNIQTNLLKYGTKYSFHNKEVKEKIKVTNLLKYGCEYSSQNKNIKQKMKNTCLEKYGVEHISQNPDIHKKQQLGGLRLKIHEPTGIQYQGKNEKHFLDYCFKNNIDIEKGKTIRYKFEENKNKVYFPDFYLKEKNLIIEIKSTHWYNMHLEMNLAKQDSCIKQGYNFIFIIDFKYDEFKKFLK